MLPLYLSALSAKETGRRVTGSSSINAFIDPARFGGNRAECNNFFNHAVPANAQRRRNLEIYLQEMLDRSPKVLLVGEAPGLGA